MGMIQNAFNQMLASGLAASYTIQQSPYFKAQQAAKTATKEAEIAEAKAITTTTEAARTAALSGNIAEQEAIASEAEETRKSAQEAALGAQYKASKISKEEYAAQYAKLQQPSEMSFQEVIQETIENDPALKAAVEAQRKALEEAQARKTAVAERRAALKQAKAEKAARDKEIADVKKQLMAQGVSEAMAERAAIADYERRQKK